MSFQELNTRINTVREVRSEGSRAITYAKNLIGSMKELGYDKQFVSQLVNDLWDHRGIGTRSSHKISPYIRGLVYERDGYQCRQCSTRTDLTIDHIIPQARGGKNHIENLQTLCRYCNAEKADRL